MGQTAAWQNYRMRRWAGADKSHRHQFQLFFGIQVDEESLKWRRRGRRARPDATCDVHRGHQWCRQHGPRRTAVWGHARGR